MRHCISNSVTRTLCISQNLCAWKSLYAFMLCILQFIHKDHNIQITVWLYFMSFTLAYWNFYTIFEAWNSFFSSSKNMVQKYVQILNIWQKTPAPPKLQFFSNLVFRENPKSKTCVKTENLERSVLLRPNVSDSRVSRKLAVSRNLGNNRSPLCIVVF